MSGAQESKHSNTALFGVSLHIAVQRSAHLNHEDSKSNAVPIVVRRACEYLNTHGKPVEGLYHVAGTKAKVREYAARFDKGIASTM